MKKLISLIIVVICASGYGFAENNNDSKDTKSENHVTFAGKIIDLQSGESLPGVKVSIKDLNIETYTDLEGNFSFDEIATGKHEVIVDYIAYNTLTLKELYINEQNPEIIIKLEEK